MASQPVKITIAIHILPNILRIKRNHGMQIWPVNRIYYQKNFPWKIIHKMGWRIPDCQNYNI